MPRCLNCGNSEIFAASTVPNTSPWTASGPTSGMIGDFSQGELRHLENSGAAHEVIREAYQSPEAYFDTCQHCGSTNLSW